MLLVWPGDKACMQDSGIQLKTFETSHLDVEVVSFALWAAVSDQNCD